MKTLILHACADAQGKILHSTCYYCCLIQFDISCQTLTWKLCLGVAAGVGRWPASILLRAIMESGPRSKSCNFKMSVIGSVNPFMLPE